jgi:2-oxoglutarate dehydrogenase E2 component (dihydrolipoamide succinyltransferase)
MTTEIKLSAEELEGTTATVSQWLVAVGEHVTKGQPILELETDKVSMEVCAPETGVIQTLDVKVGEDVTPDIALGVIGKASLQPASPAQEAQPQSEQQAQVTSKQTPVSDEHKGRISPAVRRLLKEHNLDVKQIAGTGKDGRVTRQDVEAFLASTTKVQAEPAQPRVVTAPDMPAMTDNPSTKVLHSRMRRTIANHMVTSLLHTAPHVTSVFEMDLSNIIEHRKWHKKACERQGFALTFTAYFAYATALAAAEVPEVNSRFHDDHVELFKHVNIGIGTALGDNGLVVPVIRQVETLELYDIARLLSVQTEKARNGRLTPEDLKGSTISISNHGVSGSLFASPIIINQPEVAILGIGKMEKRAVVREINGADQVVIKPMCYVSLTIDHRALDAHQTNRYLSRFVDIIENWQG